MQAEASLRSSLNVGTLILLLIIRNDDDDVSYLPAALALLLATEPHSRPDPIARKLGPEKRRRRRSPSRIKQAHLAASSLQSRSRSQLVNTQSPQDLILFSTRELCRISTIFVCRSSRILSHIMNHHHHPDPYSLYTALLQQYIQAASKHQQLAQQDASYHFLLNHNQQSSQISPSSAMLFNGKLTA